jgi:uncharacterized protein (DUF983 family)
VSDVIRSSKPRALILFTRAALLRCPACAGGPLFESWFKLKPACPGCGLWLERDEGYWTGAMGINILVAEFTWVIAFIAALMITWPHPPWQLLTYASVVLMIALPLAFFPFSRTFWVALDLLFRPVERHEFHKKPPS